MPTAQLYPSSGHGEAPFIDTEALAREIAEHARLHKRRRRYSLATFQRRSTLLRSVRLCGTSIDAEVSIGVVGQDDGLIAHVSGIARCGSPWSCPVCAPTVRETRAREIDAGVAVALALGWTVLMVSCTVPHAYTDTLEATFGTLRAAHVKTRGGRPWTALRDALGFAGSVRCWEMTYGVNGWHPHSHELLFFRGQLTDGQVAGVAGHYQATYGASVERATGKQLHAVHGVDVRRVHEQRDLGGYLTKVDGGWGAGLELARSDLKRSRGGRNPWDLLAGAADGDGAAEGPWREYEAATAGKRAVQWSKGLVDELGIREPATDEEAAVVEPPAEPVWTLTLPASQWDEVRRQGCTAQLLEECEREAGQVGKGAGP